ncbi:hypothetical protein HCN44_007312 [Aphidius gifuensis]|uniref:Uncharacterized protein n=1 Tax=Aphidius gifuensis TaxID=684658 RepID=A0A834XNX6_APHGI|nr:probable WRKY transcription factor protein 1 [Aphidius gifuensis]KAF7989002.1 hypothetical protein HCN44_007312 [Aphidius gifuensis]
MSENQEAKIDAGNIENKLKNFGINGSIDILDKKLLKSSSIDSHKDTEGTVVVDPAKNNPVEELNKIEVKDQVPTGELSRNNSIDGARNVGECRNILPVLVENLCSSLGTINDVSDEPLAPDPTSRQSTSQQQSSTSSSLLPQLSTSTIASTTSIPSTTTRDINNKKIDINYLQDLCPSDIKAAITRLEETLKSVDVDALSTDNDLEASDKTIIINLIQNLVSNLKKIKINDNNNKNDTSQSSRRTGNRHRGNRHTIGVSKEELASARKWLEQEHGQQTIKFKQQKILNKTIEKTITNDTTLSNDTTTQQSSISTSQISPENYKFVNSIPSVVRSCDKHIKDAINQQQSLQHKTKDTEFNIDINDNTLTIEQTIQQQNNDIVTSLLPTTNQTQNKSNKFFAKKSKIKRANTIDIPNYLKMQEEKKRNSLNGYADVGNRISGLRKPIDISDKITWNYYGSHQTISPAPIPNFEPKTDNDRKFLALINRNNNNNNNNDSNNSSNNNLLNKVNWNVNGNVNQPFKTFSYRQTSSVADKNWKSRFSNIKTTFDQQSLPTSPSSLPPMSSRRSSRDHDIDLTLKNGNLTPDSCTSERVNTMKFGKFDNSHDQNQNCQPSYYNPGNVVSKLPIFTHAATSPFTKISNPSPKYPDGHNKINKITDKTIEKPILSSYLPNCVSNGLLKAKVKMFDHQNSPTQIPKSTINYNRKSYPERNENRSIFVKQQQQQQDTPITSLKNQRKKDKIHRNNGHFCNDENDEDGDDEEEELKTVEKYPKKNSITTTSSQPQQQHVQSVAVQTNTSEFENKINIQDVTYPKKLSYKFVQQPEHKAFYSENENPIYIPPKIIDNYSNNEIMINRSENKAFDKIFMPIETDKMIENQDISPNKIVTRYTSAIATLASNTSESMNQDNYEFINKLPELGNTSSQQILNGIEKNQNHLITNVQEASDTQKVIGPQYQQSYQRSLNDQQDIQHNYQQSYPVLNGQRNIQHNYQPSYQVAERQNDSQKNYQQSYSTGNNCESYQNNYQPVYPVASIKDQVYTNFIPNQMSTSLQDDIDRHNMLQKNLIKRLQEKSDDEQELITSPLSPPTIEANNTQDKINIFEEKLQIMPITLPKINVINVITPTKIISQPSFPIKQLSHPKTTTKTKILPIDSSDEYLVSCANKPNRSIVLSKSESWHQLAMLNKSQVNNYLQVPTQNNNINNNKPPKPNSPLLNRLSKNFDNGMKKMEEKVQRYFNNSNNNSTTNSTTSLDCQDTIKNKTTTTTTINKRDKKLTKRNFTTFKNSGNALVRSQTMPHIFDDNLDVDEAFDSLFEEATRDNRH